MLFPGRKKKKWLSTVFLKNLWTQSQIPKQHWEKGHWKKTFCIKRGPHTCCIPSQNICSLDLKFIVDYFNLIAELQNGSLWFRCFQIVTFGFTESVSIEVTVFALSLRRSNTVPFPPVHNDCGSEGSELHFFINIEVTKYFYKLHSHLSYNYIWGLHGTLHYFNLDFHFAP